MKIPNAKTASTYGSVLCECQGEGGDFRRKYYLTLTFNLRYNDLRAGAFYATALDYHKQTVI